MKKGEIIDSFKDYPEIIESPIEMSKANSQIIIYEGEFILKDDENRIKISGKIFFDWLPSSGAYFSGIPLDKGLDTFKILNGRNTYKIIADDLEFGEGFITNTNIESFSGESKIKGVLSQQAVAGDKSIAVDKIIFAIPNLREFHGLSVKKITDNNISVSKGRLLLENDKYIITLDKSNKYKNLRDELEENGGYILLYGGEIKSKKGPIKFEDSKDIFHCLNTFLTFLNGRRTSALFMSGIFENKTMWCDYTDYFVDTFKNATSWPQNHSISNLNETWKKFSETWKDVDDRDFLTSAIHWYIEANNNSGFSEGSIIMAQTALELLYNWWIIENKKLIIGKDSENINASNKIRLLLSQLNINYTVPIAFSNLQAFIDSEKQIIDAPDAVVQIRNAIVHSQEEKRKKLSSIHYKAKYEALQLCLWYIEMTLLKILEYNDKYYNRTSSEFIKSKAIEFVPWQKK